MKSNLLSAAVRSNLQKNNNTGPVRCIHDDSKIGCIQFLRAEAKSINFINNQNNITSNAITLTEGGESPIPAPFIKIIEPVRYHNPLSN